MAGTPTHDRSPEGEMPKGAGLILVRSIKRYWWNQQTDNQKTELVADQKKEIIKGILSSEGLYGFGRLEILNEDGTSQILWEC